MGRWIKSSNKKWLQQQAVYNARREAEELATRMVQLGNGAIRSIPVNRGKYVKRVQTGSI